MKVLNYILLVPVLLMTVFSILLIFKEVKALTDIENSIYWKKNIAIINKIKLVESNGNDNNFPYDVFPLLKCDIEYSYIINDEKYIGNTLSLDSIKNNNEFQELVFNKLNKAKKIIIWTNPKTPSESTILKKSSHFENLIFGFGFLIFPIFIFVIFYFRKKHSSIELANKLEIL